MQRYSVTLPAYTTPPLDEGFLPFEHFARRYLQGAEQPVRIALRRGENQVAVYDTFVRGTPGDEQADALYLERVVKFLLWSRGGYEVSLFGGGAAARSVQEAYAPGGSRAFDAEFMQRIYGKALRVLCAPWEERVEASEQAHPIGGHLDGCRIGYDAGGSDHKVSAVLDGQPVYSEEFVWYPKEQTDPEYHYNEIVRVLRTAAEKLPRVDAIGISSAGVIVDNLVKVSSLLIKVPPERFDTEVQRLYLRAAAAVAAVPVQVANDGDVAALAGSLSLEVGGLLGVALGTSEAAGYVDRQRAICGWLNELAFAPVDLGAAPPLDEWSGDHGCGSSYFSQDAVERLAPVAGIQLDGALSKAQKLAEVQKLAEGGDERALRIFDTIGVYFGHGAALYSRFYALDHVLLMGRVTSGVGGARILEGARRVLRDDYPDLAGLDLRLPDDKSRRVGQSIAAASLPQIG